MYESLRQHVNGNLAGLQDSELAEALANRNIDAEAMEGFFDDLGKFAARAAPVVLPVAGRVIGSIYGGPAGAAIGGQLGSLAGGAISSATGQRPAAPQRAAANASVSPQPAPFAASPAGASASISAGSGSPAAGQLLQTITRPEVLQALGAMAMGSSGRQEVPVNGTAVPVAAFSNLISVLADRAVSEHGESMARLQSGVPEYMRGESGEARGDPAVEEDRARALYELLGEQLPEYESESESESEAEWAEYVSEHESAADAAEMVELAYELAEWESE